MNDPIRMVPNTVPTASVVNEADLTVEHLPDIEKAEPMAMKVRRPVDSHENNELMAIAALRDALPGGAEVVEDSWQASWLGYITKEEPYDETVATDVRGFLFPIVYKYTRRKGTRTRIIGEWWSASVLVWPSSVNVTKRHETQTG